MFQIVKSDGYVSTLGIREIPVIVDYEYRIIDGPNRFIYNKISNNDWGSPNTWNRIAVELVHFLNWLAEDEYVDRPDWDLVTSSLITRYWRAQQDRALGEKKPVPAAAINSRMKTVRRFYKWCTDNKIFTLVNVSDISKEVFVTCDSDDDLLAHCKTLNGFYQETTKLQLKVVNKSMVRFLVPKEDFVKACSYFRDIVFVICAFLYYLCGLRRSEVTEFLTLDSKLNPDLLTKKKLKRSGLIDSDYLVYRFIGKGNVVREVEIPTNLWLLILDYYLPQRILREEKFRQKMESDPREAEKNGGSTTDLLLLTKTGAKLTSENISRAFNDVQKLSGIKFRPHMLRHTYATEFIWRYEEKYPDSDRRFDAAVHDELQRMLGHSLPSTTKKYIHLVEMLESSQLMEEFRPQLDTRMGAVFKSAA